MSEDAIGTENFDLLGALEGTSYPTKTLPLYLNMNAVKAYKELGEEAAVLTNSEEDAKRNDEILTEQAELREKILNSTLYVELQGLPRSVVGAITRKIEATVKNETDRTEAINNALIVRSIVRITNHAGQTAPLTDEALETLLSKMTASVSMQFLSTMNELSFAALRYEGKVTDPNFS